MTEREHVINDYLTGDYSVSELCRRYRISRTTGHKWLDWCMTGCDLATRAQQPRSSPCPVRLTLPTPPRCSRSARRGLPAHAQLPRRVGVPARSAHESTRPGRRGDPCPRSQ